MLGRWLRAAWLAAALLVPTIARADEPTDLADARRLYAEGVERANAGRWRDAADRFGRSLAIKYAPLTQYSLGVAQRNDGKVVAALTSFRAFLAEPPADLTAPYVEPARDAIADLERQVVHLTIEVTPSGAQGLRVELDDEPVALVTLGRSRPIDPGRRTIEARAPGFVPVSRTLEAAPGTTERVQLALLESTAGDYRAAGAGLAIGGGILGASGLALAFVGLGEVGSGFVNKGATADSARAKVLAGDVIAGAGIVTGLVGVGLLLAGVDDEADVDIALELRPWTDGTQAGVRLRF